MNLLSFYQQYQFSQNFLKKKITLSNFIILITCNQVKESFNVKTSKLNFLNQKISSQIVSKIIFHV